MPPLISPTARQGYFEATRLPYAACVSWPRSGHGMLTRVLRGIFGPAYGYCEYYEPRRIKGIPCCGQFPCRKTNRIHLSKQHDFALDAELPPDFRLIVQYRAFEPSLTSNWELFITHQPGKNNAEGFREFALRQAARYRGFIAKWVEADRTNRIILPYEVLTAEPVETFRRLVVFYEAPEFLPCVEEAVKNVPRVSFGKGKRVVGTEAGVKATRVVEDFRFYDKALFEELNAIAAGEHEPS